MRESKVILKNNGNENSGKAPRRSDAAKTLYHGGRLEGTTCHLTKW